MHQRPLLSLLLHCVFNFHGALKDSLSPAATKKGTSLSVFFFFPVTGKRKLTTFTQQGNLTRPIFCQEIQRWTESTIEKSHYLPTKCIHSENAFVSTLISPKVYLHMNKFHPSQVIVYLQFFSIEIKWYSFKITYPNCPMYSHIPSSIWIISALISLIKGGVTEDTRWATF